MKYLTARFDVGQLLKKMETATNNSTSAHQHFNIVILDACRNNPFARSFRGGSTQSGFSFGDSTPKGTLIAYAAKSGTRSMDGERRNGLFTEKLLQHIHTPGLKITDLMMTVRQEVVQATDAKQIPVEENLLLRPFCFTVCSGREPPPPAAPTDSVNLEVVYWNSIKDSDNPADFQAYLSQYPNGTFTRLARNRLAPKPPNTNDCRDCPEMVTIPGGEFMMGDDNSEYSDQRPRHSVTVAGFRIGKYEVTQAQWQAVMGDNPSQVVDCDQRCPVQQVNYDDIQRFISQLNQRSSQRYRLPTEAEWEYACHAGGSEQYCGSDNVDSVAWYVNNSFTTHPVGQKPVGQKQANAWGLYDMSGNVFEWTCSAYTKQGYIGQEKTCNYDAYTSFVVRGGSGNADPQSARSAYRLEVDATQRAGILGFRLAQDN
ncbi:SUMF1/EgtB/PvdO family nonheme iron enzyme [Methylocucumis oryzae]|uniref:SUMF1/EgtB/PvdO family nonheme iron enzyme n=1 Tax=Methylocucumis oryzae TaxID=1632867 RepID=UPI0006974B95|nr:SUMF1/EgtB/PvdO family nonheme iron enzyme [Methylocucumis oryzae]